MREPLLPALAALLSAPVLAPVPPVDGGVDTAPGLCGIRLLCPGDAGECSCPDNTKENEPPKTPEK